MPPVHRFLAVLILVSSQGDTLTQEPPPLDLVLQTGHASPAGWALSGDGKWLVSVSHQDSSVILWEAATGKAVRRFHGHTGPVTGVGISGDGKLVLTGSSDRTAILWDAVTGKKIHTFKDDGDKIDLISAVALSTDGKRVLTASAGYRLGIWKGNLILWDAANGAQLEKTVANNKIPRVSLSADGKQAVTGDFWWAQQWQTGPLRVGSYLTLSSTSSIRVALSLDGKVGVTSNWAEVTLWETVKGTRNRLHVLKEHTSQPTNQITNLLLSDDGKRLVTAANDGTAILWDTATGKKLQSYQGEKKSTGMYVVALSGDNKRLILRDRSAVPSTALWDADSGKKLRDLPDLHISAVTSLALSGDGKSLLAGMGDGHAHLWKLDEGKKALTVYQGIGNPLYDRLLAVGLTDDGKRFATIIRLRWATLWESADGTKIREKSAGLPMADELITFIRVFDDGKRIKLGAGLQGARPKYVHLWEVDDRESLKVFKDGHKREVTSVALSRDEKRLVTGSEKEGKAVLWDVALGKVIQTYEIPPGKLIVPHEGHGAPTSVALSDDGKHVLTGTADNRVILWDAATAKKIQTFEGHAGPVTGLVLSGDGKRLWTASEDGTVRLWDVAAGKELCRLYALDAGKDWLVVTPEGNFDGSEGAWRFVAYRETGSLKLIDDDATRKKFHRPGLLAKVWKGES